MNNPATMGMDKKAGNAFQIAVGGLNPTISSKHTSGAKSDSTGSFIMPGFGYARKTNRFMYGVGVMAQGGMGTDYGKASATNNLFGGGNSTGGWGNNGETPGNGTAHTNTQGALSGQNIRSEVGVGRLIIPLGYDVSDKLTIAGSIDYVWGGMDLQMDMDGASFNQLMQGNGGSVSGTMAQGLNMYMSKGSTTIPPGSQTPGNANAPAVINDLYWARFDFSDNSSFTQKTKGTGFAGKLGFVYKLSDKLTIGGSYHSKTKMSDFTGDATLSMRVSMDSGVLQGGNPNGTYTDATMPVTGKIKVKDFQWPETMAIGLAWKATPSVLITADVKQSEWADVMKSCKMTFDADSSASNGNFKNTSLDVTMDQNWKDQTVTMLGAEWQASKNLALRAGYNVANNPVPDATLNPLFPATIQSHYTAGFGYQFTKEQSIDASFTVAPKVTATNPNTGISTSHSQTNWQLMYSYIWGVK